MTNSLFSYNASHTLATLHSSFGSLFSIFAPNPHVLRDWWIILVATHDGKSEFVSLSGAWLTPLLLVPAA